MITGLIVGAIVGFIAGALVARNNIDEVNKVVLETAELLDKAEKELKVLKAKKKPVATKKKTTATKKKTTAAKKTVKKPQVD
jgi:gas vesicle protein